jgi:hypothetical protein
VFLSLTRLPALQVYIREDGIKREREDGVSVRKSEEEEKTEKDGLLATKREEAVA